MVNNNEAVSDLQTTIDRLYDQARGYVIHEDDLVDRRLKWSITISGFLFAAYGATWIAFPKESLVDENSLSLILVWVQISLGIFGFLVSIISVPSIHAAHLAIRAVTRKYTNFIEANELAIRDQKVQVWKLIGDKVTHLPGFYSSLFLPILLAAAWIIVLAIDAAILAYIILFSLGFHAYVEMGFAVILTAAICCLSVLGRYSLRLKKKLENAAEESETVKELRARGDTSNISVISEDSFLVLLFSKPKKSDLSS